MQTARRDVMADHRDGIERVADYPAHGSLIDAEFGKPAPVINLGEQHEADFADQTIDLLRKLCSVIGSSASATTSPKNVAPVSLGSLTSASS